MTEATKKYSAETATSALASKTAVSSPLRTKLRRALLVLVGIVLVWLCYSERFQPSSFHAAGPNSHTSDD
ncbi:hypothetical protein HFO56_01770 [Rhizobium laguerreae]|uniref:hypothetical protein n=1 Tax=Rhizobium laguerreae TaxID=1076926 RepID=UPI001C9183A3|nr:hypothetical protein [Rhizobium laguerreae]MBY3151134.1 hypothetical protein [Rhizobium laguerreae]